MMVHNFCRELGTLSGCNLKQFIALDLHWSSPTPFGHGFGDLCKEVKQKIPPESHCLSLVCPSLATIKWRFGDRSFSSRECEKDLFAKCFSGAKNWSEEVRGTIDLKDGYSRQQRWYARSNCEKARADGDDMATQMIKYAATSRSQDASHAEAVRVLEQGRGFLSGDGAASATATGRVLLTLATFYVDRANLPDAVEALQKAADLESASLEVRVAALEALAGVCLRLHQEESALGYANSCCQLVKAFKDQVSKEDLEELEFRGNAIAALASLVCAQCGAAESWLLNEVPTWIGENSSRMDGIAAAVLSLAQCAHVGGYLELARKLYERAIAIVANSETSVFTMASVAMTSEEVHVGALAGLRQLEAHVGSFDLAEGRITDALTRAEQINGDRHPRVGMVLACLADVYAWRGKAKGTGDTIITEGLYRRCLELLGAPSLDVAEPGKNVDLCDVMAVSRARYADIICKVPNRDAEADRMKKWASLMWRGPRPLLDLLSADTSQHKDGLKPTQPPPDTGAKPNLYGTQDGYVVIDVRLGRVIWKMT